MPEYICAIANLYGKVAFRACAQCKYLLCISLIDKHALTPPYKVRRRNGTPLTGLDETHCSQSFVKNHTYVMLLQFGIIMTL